MKASPQEQIDSRSEPSPLAIIGAILAQGAIRWMDRQKREQQATPEKSRKHVASIESPKTTQLYEGKQHSLPMRSD